MAQSAAGYLAGLPRYKAERLIPKGEPIDAPTPHGGWQQVATACEAIPRGWLFTIKDGLAHKVAPAATGKPPGTQPKRRARSSAI